MGICWPLLRDSSLERKWVYDDVYARAPEIVQMPHILFTGLEDYKARGTQAAPYFTVSHYKEFAETKDLVLIRGDIVFASKLTDDEAKWLLETAQSFYLNDTRYKLVERFNKQTSEFEFKDVLRALDMPMM
ncbi:ATP synthase mitochondrial F1 complex assembly factor 1 [Tanacetum coccineum]